ncbi:unnamed protein product [Caretta caretta]
MQTSAADQNTLLFSSFLLMTLFRVNNLEAYTLGSLTTAICFDGAGQCQTEGSAPEYVRYTPILELKCYFNWIPAGLIAWSRDQPECLITSVTQMTYQQSFLEFVLHIILK